MAQYALSNISDANQANFLNNGLHFFASEGGVYNVAGGAMEVTERGTPNLSVDVAIGMAAVENIAWSEGDQTEPRFLIFINDAVQNVSINSNSSGNPRITSIFLEVDNGASASSQGSASASIIAVDGTPAASPTAPAVPSDGDSYLRLADVTVADSASSITDSDIADRRITVDVNVGGAWVQPFSSWSITSRDSTSRMATIGVGTGNGSAFDLGMRVKYTQNDTIRYGIIHKINTSSIEVFHQTGNFPTATGAVTEPYYSRINAKGFPVGREDWSLELSDTGVNAQSSPATGTFYNPGGLSLKLGPGAWSVGYDTHAFVNDNSRAGFIGMQVTLSTANNTESESKFTCRPAFSTSTSNNKDIIAPVSRRRNVLNSAETTYFLNVSTDISGMDQIGVRGFRGDTVISATSNYL